MLVLGSSVPVRKMTSASCCPLTNHCCRLFSLNLACWPPPAQSAGITCTACSLGYAMLPFRFCTTFTLKLYSRLLIMAGRVTSWTSTPVLCALSSLSGLLVGAPPGLEPGMCAQQWVCGHPTVLQELALAGSSTVLLAGTHTVRRGRLQLFCLWGSSISRSDAEMMQSVFLIKIILKPL